MPAGLARLLLDQYPIAQPRGGPAPADELKENKDTEEEEEGRR